MIYKKILFLENVSLFDSELDMLNISSSENIVQIEILVRVNYLNKFFLKLIFKNVIDYSFNWNDIYSFDDSPTINVDNCF